MDSKNCTNAFVYKTEIELQTWKTSLWFSGIRWGGINWKIGINTSILLNRASLMAQLVKNPPAMMETWVRSLGWEDPLAKEVATHSSLLAWRIPWTKEPGGPQSMGSQELDITE